MLIISNRQMVNLKTHRKLHTIITNSTTSQVVNIWFYDQLLLRNG